PVWRDAEGEDRAFPSSSPSRRVESQESRGQSQTPTSHGGPTALPRAGVTSLPPRPRRRRQTGGCCNSWATLNTSSFPLARGCRMERPLDVLVVENHPPAARILAELLVLDGHRVRLAPDGPSAVALAAASAPDVALLDLNLGGGMDGY